MKIIELIKIIIVLLLITLSGCSNHKTECINSSEIKKDTLKNQNIEILVDSVIFDDGEVIYPDTIYLKNQYALYQYFTYKDKYYYFNIKLKGENIDTVIWEYGITSRTHLPYYLPYYKGNDFNDCFAINQSGGGNYYLPVYLFEKKTGNVIVEGYEGVYDLNNELMLYDEQEEGINRDKIILFDIMNNKKTIIDEEKFDDPCFGGMGSLSFYTFGKITDELIIIEYYNSACKRKYQFEIPR